MRLHPSITPERIESAVRRHRETLDDPGFCIVCGADAEGVEPDARKYPCHVCGCLSVYGAEEILIAMF